MLTMYAQLRGVQPRKISDLVSATIQHLSLTKWADKLCGDYRQVKYHLLHSSVFLSKLVGRGGGGGAKSCFLFRNLNHRPVRYLGILELVTA